MPLSLLLSQIDTKSDSAIRHSVYKVAVRSHRPIERCNNPVAANIFEARLDTDIVWPGSPRPLPDAAETASSWM